MVGFFGLIAIILMIWGWKQKKKEGQEKKGKNKLIAGIVCFVIAGILVNGEDVDVVEDAEEVVQAEEVEEVQEEAEETDAEREEREKAEAEEIAEKEKVEKEKAEKEKQAELNDFQKEQIAWWIEDKMEFGVINVLPTEDDYSVLNVVMMNEFKLLNDNEKQYIIDDLGFTANNFFSVNFNHESVWVDFIYQDGTTVATQKIFGGWKLK